MRLRGANDIVDRYWDRVEVGGSTARESVAFAGTGRPMLPGILEFPKPDCEPFREMLAHPVLVKYLNVMCDKGFRLDHGPMFIVSNKGTAGHTMHGNGEPHRPHVGLSPSKWQDVGWRCDCGVAVARLQGRHGGICLCAFEP